MISLATILVVAYTAYKLPQQLLRWIFQTMFFLLYRVRVRGLENIPKEGPAVLVGNHSSWLDGAIILTYIPRRLRSIAWAGNFKSWFLKGFARFCGVILITGGPKSIVRSLNEAAEALNDGQMVALFPEGGITRTGQVRTFREGLMKVLAKVDRPVPVIPFYIDELWGSVFSYSGRRAIYKLPNSFRRPISFHIGKPMDAKPTMHEMRLAVQRVGAECVEHHVGKFRPVTSATIRQCKRSRFREKIGDSTGQKETGGSLLTRALVLRRLLKKNVLAADETNVGVLIPPSNGGVIVNVALSLDRRVAVNLNYSLSEELINFCIKEAGIKHVLTSKKVMSKFNFNLDCEVFFLEDLKDKVSTTDKVMSAFAAYVTPAFILNWSLGLSKTKPHDLFTIIFTSGSTGVPKGVMLSHRNVATNVAAIDQAASFTSKDAMIGVLPFFHSFGYTATLWAPMASVIRGAYHFSPLDPKQVGKLVERYQGTTLVATPTFLRSYLRRCSEEQFKSLDIVITGAERLPPELAAQFVEKFGVLPVEGYGATETSPLVSINIPDSRKFDKFQIDRKEGTVGRTAANIATKVTDLDSGKELGAGQAGMLWIKGPNVMLGYLNRKDLTDEVIVDGWYKTGDVALVDEDGFIKITGRISRFSKIGGEMVPHVKIEEILTELCDLTPNDDDANDQPNVAVTAVSDVKKGERLIVLHTKIPVAVDDLRKGLSDAGLPNIYIPSADSFRQVDELPLLGSGKIDLKGIKKMAEELFDGGK